MALKKQKTEVKGNNKNNKVKRDETLNIEVGEWIYNRGTAGMSRNRWYECPRCAKVVQQKENFCPECGLVFDTDAYKKYILGEA